MADSIVEPGGAAALVKQLAPYAPGIAGAIISMAWGENLTLRGKALAAVVGVCAVLWVAPLLTAVATLAWPWGEFPKAGSEFVGFVTGVFGFVVLSGLAQAFARYASDPLRLVKIHLGGVTITGGPNGEA